MRFGERLRYFLFRKGRDLSTSREKGWSGLSLLIAKDDSAAAPVRVRINYYVAIFMGLLFVGLPLTSAGLFVYRNVSEQRSKEQVQARVIMLFNLRLATLEKAGAMERIRTQILDIQKAADPGEAALLKSYLDNPAEAGEDPVRAFESSGRDVADLRVLRARTERLTGEAAYYALNMVWNRLSLHHLLPHGRPLRQGIGSITSAFGRRPDPFTQIETGGDFHNGLDFAAAPDTPIIATAPGYVIRAVKEDKEGYGLHVRIHHGHGYTSLYAHCSKIMVEKDDFIRRGQVIATVGRTGHATGPHVHYEVQLGNGPTVDPMQYVQLR
ncbi:MAG: M23 family metallopeptidase [Spirochaetia bacterium]|nr:M23 family metallopeptidase [Spirochaetia bacterium]